MNKKKKYRSELPPARLAAIDALSACLFKGQDIQAALDAALTSIASGRTPDPRDAGLATELVYGYLRLRLRLDFVLDSQLKAPKKTPKLMRLALGLAAFEILNLDRVPSYASVDWCVDFVKRDINPRLAGVSNAVLRGVDRLGAEANSHDFYRQDDADRDTFLSRYYACPAWLVKLWRKAYGERKTVALLRASTKAPALGLRFDFRKDGARESYDALRENELCKESTPVGLAFQAPCPECLEAEAAGFAVRQSLAGQQALFELGAEDWARPVWDACSGRGGKTLLLHAIGGGPIYASDPSEKRLSGLRALLEAKGISDITTAVATADEGQVFDQRFPCVLVDAPCSGLGVLSRRPDAKARRSKKDITELSKLQAKILDNAWNALEPGGSLIYVTCTITPQENEMQVDTFLRRTPGAKLLSRFRTPEDTPLGEFFFGARFEKSAE